MTLPSQVPDRPLQLLIGLPAYGSTLWTETFHTLVANMLNLREAFPGINIKTSVIDFAEIDWARNLFATMLLDGNYDYLIMVDSDMAFPPHVMQRLIKSGHDVCGLIYPKRQIDLERFHREAASGADYGTAMTRSLEFVSAKNVVLEGRKFEVTNGFAQFSAIPGGCLCIKRDVVVRMWDEIPSIRLGEYTGPKVSDHEFKRVARVFDKMVDEATGRRFSEDYSFCLRWGGLGGMVHALLDVPVTHWGRQKYQGNAIDLFKDRSVRPK